ncbi:hypothetical protein GCM10023189_53640 [Nibrella saemangeumensis]|uniref:Uncharacterized protein n=1 Tax=Nibrella saemangeumensis TaxID=1084526 RepID=A0ABP8NN77_9BACT
MMEPKIEQEQLRVVEEYLDSVKSPDSVKHIQGGIFLCEETDKIFPIITLLLEYGYKRFGGSDHRDKVNYETVYKRSKGDPTLTRDIAVNSPDMLRHLITDYRTEANTRAIEDLFSKKLADMTGYEFQAYARMIGLIP